MPQYQYTRREALLTTGSGLLAATLLVACGSDDGGSATTSSPPATTGGSAGAATSTGAAVPAVDLATQLAWIKTVQFAGFWLAEDRGFYAENGISPEFLAGGPNAPAAEVAVAGGVAPVGISTSQLNLLDSIAEGADLVMWAAIYQSAPSGLASLADNPIVTAKDIVGKRIGMQPGAEASVDGVLKLAGLEPGSYTSVPVGVAPEPLAAGDVDAFVCFVTSQPGMLREAGLDVVATSYASMGLERYAGVLISPRAYLQEHHDELVRYLRATIMGWELNLAEPTAAPQLVLDRYGADLELELAQQQDENDRQNELIVSDYTRQHGLLQIDIDTLGGVMYDGFRATGRADLPPVEDIVDLSILADAYAGKSSLLD